MAATSEAGDHSATIHYICIRMSQTSNVVYRAVGRATMASAQGPQSVEASSEMVIAKREHWWQGSGDYWFPRKNFISLSKVNIVLEIF